MENNIFDQHSTNSVLDITIRHTSGDIVITGCQNLDLRFSDDMSIENLYILGDVSKLTIHNYNRNDVFIKNIILYNVEEVKGLGFITSSNIIDYKNSSNNTSNVFPEILEDHVKELLVKLIWKCIDKLVFI